MTRPPITILTVTKRPHLRDWLLWNISRQTYPHIEHIIIEHTSGTYLEALNHALSLATGDYLTWFGDDDYQHPEKISWLMQGAADYPNFSAVAWGWGNGLFYDLCTGLISSYINPSLVCSNALISTPDAQRVPFESQARSGATDTQWFERIAGTKITLLPRPHSVWLVHFGNTARRSYDWRAGDPGWDAETAQRVNALRSTVLAPLHPEIG